MISGYYQVIKTGGGWEPPPSPAWCPVLTGPANHATIKKDFGEIKGSWDYITNMTHLTTSKKSIERLEKELETVKANLKYYEDSKPWKIWLDELKEFEKEYVKYLKDNQMNQKFETVPVKKKN